MNTRAENIIPVRQFCKLFGKNLEEFKQFDHKVMWFIPEYYTLNLIQWIFTDYSVNCAIGNSAKSFKNQ